MLEVAKNVSPNSHFTLGNILELELPSIKLMVLPAMSLNVIVMVEGVSKLARITRLSETGLGYTRIYS
jgi:hypothetical protein